jgi:hypothetical protein
MRTHIYAAMLTFAFAQAFVPIKPAMVQLRSARAAEGSKGRSLSLRMAEKNPESDDVVVRRVDAMLDVTPMPLLWAFFEHVWESPAREMPADHGMPAGAASLLGAFVLPSVQHPADPAAGGLSPSARNALENGDPFNQLAFVSYTQHLSMHALLHTSVLFSSNTPDSAIGKEKRVS